MAFYERVSGACMNATYFRPEVFIQIYLWDATTKLQLFIVVLLILVIFTLLNFDVDEQEIKQCAYM